MRSLTVILLLLLPLRVQAQAITLTGCNVSATVPSVDGAGVFTAVNADAPPPSPVLTLPTTKVGQLFTATVALPDAVYMVLAPGAAVTNVLSNASVILVRSSAGACALEPWPGGSVTPVPGPAGPVGPMGPVGPPGPTGASGVNGVNGVNGAKGADGLAGLPGATGLTGASGPAGAGLVTGSFLFLAVGVSPPSGYLPIGATVLNIGSGSKLTLNVYRKQ